MSPHALTFAGSLNSQYSPSIRFSSFSFRSSGNWMLLGLKYMLRTLSCSSILQGQDGIVSIFLNEFVHPARLALNRLEGVSTLLGTESELEDEFGATTEGGNFEQRMVGCGTWV